MRLRRITTSGAWVPEIDGLRFVAILWVVLFHIGVQTGVGTGRQNHLNPLQLAVSHGHRGVPLFFAISGFILGLPFASEYLRGAKHVNLKSYFLRRLTRLEPPYVLAMLFRSALLIFAVHKPLREIAAPAIASLIYVHSLVFGRGSVINPPAWSLEVEVQFYCLAPLLAFLYFSLSSRLGRRALVILVIVLGTSIHVLAPNPRIELSLAGNLQYFLAGFLLVDLYSSDWSGIPEHFAWDFASLACWLLIFLDAEGRVLFYLPLITVVAYVGAFKGLLFPRVFRLKWIAVLGGMCYSLYLTHNLSISLVWAGLSRFSGTRGLQGWARVFVTYGACLPVVLGIGLLLFVFLERPCMDKDWPRKLYRRLTGKVHFPDISSYDSARSRTAGPDTISE